MAVPTGEVETVDCGLVITSIGYKSLPIDPEVPFDPRKAIVPNTLGRVQQAAGTHGGVTSRYRLLSTWKGLILVPRSRKDHTDASTQS